MSNYKEYWIEPNGQAYCEKVDGLDEDAVHVIEISAYEAIETKLANTIKAYEELLSVHLKMRETHAKERKKLIENFTNATYNLDDIVKDCGDRIQDAILKMRED